MPGTPTTKYAIPTLAGTDLARDIDTLVNLALTSIDGKMVGYSAGLFSARPTSTGGSPGIAGRRYRATDTGQEFIDTGTSWVEIGEVAAHGYAEVLTDQQAVTTGPVDLTTAGPSVTLTVPANGLVQVFVAVELKVSAAGAAVFLLEDGVEMFAVGDQSILPAASSTSFVNAYSAPSSGSAYGTFERPAASWLTFPASAGAHTYKLAYGRVGASGSANFRNRKLWVRVLPA